MKRLRLVLGFDMLFNSLTIKICKIENEFETRESEERRSEGSSSAAYILHFKSSKRQKEKTFDTFSAAPPTSFVWEVRRENTPKVDHKSRIKKMRFFHRVDMTFVARIDIT